MPSAFGYTWEVVPEVQSIIGWSAVVAVLGLFMAPAKDIWGKDGVARLRSTRHLATGFPYFASFFNCLFWIIYASGNVQKLLQPLVINAIGAALHLSFLSCYLCFVEEKQSSLVALVSGITLTAASTVWATLQHSVSAFGMLAAVLNSVMYYSPLAAVGTVVKENWQYINTIIATKDAMKTYLAQCENSKPILLPRILSSFKQEELATVSPIEGVMKYRYLCQHNLTLALREILYRCHRACG
ncbi:hypothetical protein CYMTET_50400 [Cymbomonas tetramitiformis]|uniref:Bidirectional sugar transporter SWEET n=1 Tax=Cymbomonas tetramitiformis TaxID=36881 RepID=A0AAE0BQ66_9CHLO|nr:hypothetical protein CYMTET_50400 [Cymbomonas tetramitiformis]